MARTNGEVQLYDAQREFAVDQMYAKLTRGIEKLTPETAVDGLLYGADNIQKSVEALIDKLYSGAETHQGSVLNEKAAAYTSATAHVQEAISEATAGGDFSSIDSLLQEATRASMDARAAVGKMKHIKDRGRGGFDTRKALLSHAQELQSFAESYSTAPRLEDKLRGE